MHTILSRMVMCSCQWCRERFPTFHLAFEPLEWLQKSMEILKKGRTGVAACNVDVASWRELPAFPEKGGEDDAIAGECDGVCLRCQKDIDRQQQNETPESAPAAVVPKFSYLNTMDPNYQFPEHFLELFQMATTTEAMLVSLEHMQVHYATVGRTGLSKFRRNVISFPQGVAGVAKRLRLLEGYKVGDRVNSLRGPGENKDRPMKKSSNATPDELQRCARDEDGYLVFPATVVQVGEADLLLQYDGTGEVQQGWEETRHVTPRICMPSHPRFLKGEFSIMLRRNVGRGVVLEGLEVRWWLVSALLRVLMRYHKWYRRDRRLFDVAFGSEEALFGEPAATQQEARVREQCQALLLEGGAEKLEGAWPFDGKTTVPDLRRADQFADAGFEVRFMDEDPADATTEGEESTRFVVDAASFQRWLEVPDTKVGLQV